MGCSVSGDTRRQRFTPAYSTDDTTVYLSTDATSHATPTSVCLLLRHDSAKRRRQRLRKFVFVSCVYSA